MLKIFRRSTRTGIVAIVLLVLLAVGSPTALGYLEPFHRKLSLLALEQLASERDILSQLGLHESDRFGHTTGLNPFSNPKHTADDWILAGSEDEDANISGPVVSTNFPPPFSLIPVLVRTRHHFFDPEHQVGATLVGVEVGSSTLKWVTEGKDVLSEMPDNIFTIDDAKDYLRTAVTDPDLDVREKAWGDLFYTLGHLIHLVQDMAQPQHVRDDFHFHPKSTVRTDLGDSVFSGYSRYERYTYENINTGKFKFTGYQTVHLPTLENYWEGAEMGLAEFVNHNFVSADTNVDVARYSRPDPAKVSLLPPVDESPVLFGEDLLSGTLAQLVGITFPVRYGSFQYEDAYTGNKGVNPRLTARSVLDLVNSRIGKEPVWTLTSRNFDAHADLLLPRAVGYSAGFLDRFFRGQIEISAPGRHYYAVTDQRNADGSDVSFDSLLVGLRNATPDLEMPNKTPVPQPITSGTMKLIARYHRNGCYDEELDGEFTPSGRIPNGCSFSTYRGQEEISVSKEMQLIGEIPSNSPLEVEFDFTENPIPIDARDIILKIFFEGEVGGQQEIIVSTKDISEPTVFSVLNSTDYYNLKGTYYPAQQILDDPALLSQVHPNPIVATNRVMPEPFDDVRISFNNLPIASVPSLPVLGYNRIAILADPVTIKFSVSTGVGGATLQNLAFKSFLDKDSGAYRVAPIEKFRGLNFFFLVFITKDTGSIPADSSTLPVIQNPGPVFVPTDIP